MKSIKALKFSGLCGCIALSILFGSEASVAGTFSIIDPGLTMGDELFGPGPAPSGVGVGAEVNALSYGRSGVTSAAFITGVEFSVDSVSTSAFPGSPIGSEIGAGESASADIFGSPFPTLGAHFGVWDADGVGPGPNGPGGAPPLGLSDAPGGDDVDGWDIRFPGMATDIYFSLDTASALLAGVSEGDVLFSPIAPGYSTAGPGGIYAPAVALGLLPMDDIDALVVFENDGMPGVFTPGIDGIAFSLAPGSPTLVGSGLSAADIFIDAGAAGPFGVTTIGGVGTPGLLVPAGTLDLAPTDNLNALDFHTIPEPGVLSLFGLGFIGLIIRRRGEAGSPA